jgi:hypothetical protein
VNPPGEDVAVNVVTADPPVAFAVNGTDAVVEEADVAVPIVGACGTVVAVTDAEAEEAVDVPLAFVAVIVYV